MLIASLFAVLLNLSTPSSYRERFPLPGPTVPEGWGVNVNLKDMDEDDLGAIEATGAKWIRLDLQWNRVEQRAGVFKFSKYDPVIDGLQRHGLRAILILDYGNKAEGVDVPSTPEGRTAFANFAAAAVRHYKHKGVIWEIWNEPNLGHFWHGQPNAGEYASLVRQVVPVMRAESSDEWIMGMATSRFDWPFIESCFQTGVLEDLDAVSVHPYRDNNDPETVASDWAQLDNLIAKYEPSGKHVMPICSEWGYSTYSKGVSEQKQGEYAAREYLANLAAGVPLTIWYSWKDRSDASSEKEQNFGMVHADLQPKASHDTMQRVVSGLSGYTFDQRADLGNDLDVALVFRRGTSRKLAAWTSDGRQKEVRLPASLSQFAPSGRRFTLTNDVQVVSGS